MTSEDEDALAEALEGFQLDVVVGDAHTSGYVLRPRKTARALIAQLSANAAHKSDPWAEVPVVHVHCEHVLSSLASDELTVMDKITGLLRHRPERSRRRILNWAKDFLLDRDEPPF